VPRGEGLESRCAGDVLRAPEASRGAPRMRVPAHPGARIGTITSGNLRLLRALGSRRTLERDLSPGRGAQRGRVPGGPELRIHGLTRERLCVPLNSVYRRGNEGHGGSSRDGKSVG